MTAASKADYAEAFVRRHGFDPKTEDGRRRVEAILSAAEVCETYAQFTRAANYAVDSQFDTTQYDDDLTPVTPSAVA